MKKPFRISLLSCLALLAVHHAVAQPYDPEKVSKKAMALFNQARQRAADDNLPGAIGFLQQAIALDGRFADAYLALGALYGKMKNYRNGVKQYESAFAIDSAYTLDYKPAYARQLAGLGEFGKAHEELTELLTRKPPRNPSVLEKMQKEQRSYRFAVDYARTHPDSSYVFAPANAGPGVNSRESEYFPTLSLDGSQLVFTRRVGDRNEDFYSAARDKENKWGMAAPLPGNVNTPFSEAAPTLSADGQWMIFTARDRRDNFGGYDLYFSYRTPLGWSDAENLGPLVNSDQWDSQPCLSPDKQDLYFASRRPGGSGGSDIYVCHWKNGQWTKPENLGPGINTPGDDQCPFLHADNQTLYFTSNGWPGYGENDLFVTRKQPNGTWDTPLNLGYPINTIDDEGTLFIATDGKTAYYASDRSDSRGGLDIYSFELRQNVRPAKTLWVKGNVTDKKTGAPLAAVIELIDLETHRPVSTVHCPSSGDYLVTLPAGKNYAFEVAHPGYLFFSDQFLLASLPPDSTYDKPIALQPIEVNATVVLRNVFFESNQFDLAPASIAELDKLVELMRANPALKIEIGGHTDNVGRPADNLALSQHRAKAVVDYLIAKNIAPSRLQARGFGETKPLADNRTEAGRAQNRRTEMKVLAR